VRFELTRPFGLPVFKTGAINRSATPPEEIRSAKSVPLLRTGASPDNFSGALSAPERHDRRSQTAAAEELRSTFKYVHVNLMGASEKEVPPCC
jgi:hypothetical protein